MADDPLPPDWMLKQAVDTHRWPDGEPVTEREHWLVGWLLRVKGEAETYAAQLEAVEKQYRKTPSP